MLLFNETTSLSCLDIEVTDDLVFELSEQFTLQLYTSTTFIMLNPDTATVNIADNDGELASHSHTYMYIYLVYIVITWVDQRHHPCCTSCCLCFTTNQYWFQS